LTFIFSISFCLRRESSAVEGSHATSIAQISDRQCFDVKIGKT